MNRLYLYHYHYRKVGRRNLSLLFPLISFLLFVDSLSAYAHSNSNTAKSKEAATAEHSSLEKSSTAPGTVNVNNNGRLIVIKSRSSKNGNSNKTDSVVVQSITDDKIQPPSTFQKNIHGKEQAEKLETIGTLTNKNTNQTRQISDFLRSKHARNINRRRPQGHPSMRRKQFSPIAPGRQNGQNAPQRSASNVNRPVFTINKNQNLYGSNFRLTPKTVVPNMANSENQPHRHHHHHYVVDSFEDYYDDNEKLVPNVGFEQQRPYHRHQSDSREDLLIAKQLHHHSHDVHPSEFAAEQFNHGYRYGDSSFSKKAHKTPLSDQLSVLDLLKFLIARGSFKGGDNYPISAHRAMNEDASLLAEPPPTTTSTTTTTTQSTTTSTSTTTTTPPTTTTTLLIHPAFTYDLNLLKPSEVRGNIYHDRSWPTDQEMLESSPFSSFLQKWLQAGQSRPSNVENPNVAFQNQRPPTDQHLQYRRVLQPRLPANVVRLWPPESETTTVVASTPPPSYGSYKIYLEPPSEFPEVKDTADESPFVDTPQMTPDTLAAAVQAAAQLQMANGGNINQQNSKESAVGPSDRIYVIQVPNQSSKQEVPQQQQHHQLFLQQSKQQQNQPSMPVQSQQFQGQMQNGGLQMMPQIQQFQPNLQMMQQVPQVLSTGQQVQMIPQQQQQLSLAGFSPQGLAPTMPQSSIPQQVQQPMSLQQMPQQIQAQAGIQSSPQLMQPVPQTQMIPGQLPPQGYQPAPTAHQQPLPQQQAMPQMPMPGHAMPQPMMHQPAYMPAQPNMQQQQQQQQVQYQQQMPMGMHQQPPMPSQHQQLSPYGQGVPPMGMPQQQMGAPMAMGGHQRPPANGPYYAPSQPHAHPPPGVPRRPPTAPQFGRHQQDYVPPRKPPSSPMDGPADGGDEHAPGMPYYQVAGSPHEANNAAPVRIGGSPAGGARRLPSGGRAPPPSSDGPVRLGPSSGGAVGGPVDSGPRRLPASGRGPSRPQAPSRSPGKPKPPTPGGRSPARQVHVQHHNQPQSPAFGGDHNKDRWARMETVMPPRPVG